MGKEDYTKKECQAENDEGDLEKLSRAERIKRLRAEGKGWTGIFESVIYSSGPGDNIYVYG